MNMNRIRSFSAVLAGSLFHLFGLGMGTPGCLAQAPAAPAPAPPAPTPPAPTPPAPTEPAAQAPEPTGVDLFARQAAALAPKVQTGLAKAMLAAAAELPRIQARSIFRHRATRAWYTKAQADALPQADRAQLEERPVDESFYYNTKYGTPVAYTRPIEILASLGFPSQDPATASPSPLAQRRVLDFGYGGIGAARLLAILGADAVGVDVDPLLPVLYSQPEDQGPIAPLLSPDDRTPRRFAGRVRLVNGRWPSEEAARSAVGGGFDLIISKNTLKSGYLHPAEKVDPRMLVNLGVPDDEFVAALHAALNPGGWLMIYNLGPAPAAPGKPYIPWADGRCPFTREQFERAGFEVLALDVVDDGPAREMARSLGWDTQGMDIEHDLFCWYTVVRRR